MITRISCDEWWNGRAFLVLPSGAAISGPVLIEQAFRNPHNVELTHAVRWAADALARAGCGTFVPALRNLEIYMRQSQARARDQAAARIAEISRRAIDPRWRRLFQPRHRG